jgi:hypothetical protein
MLVRLRQVISWFTSANSSYVSIHT